jgi:hypothetical protein
MTSRFETGRCAVASGLSRFRVMLRSWASRVATVLLIAGMLGGGAGAPVLDALVYHRDAAHPDHPVTHLEPRGTRHTHSDACTLGWLLRVQPSASAIFTPLVVPVRLAVAALRSPAPPPRAASFFSPQDSRAPPARSA